MLSHTHYTQYLLLTVARHTNTAWPNSSFLYHLTPPPPTCQGFDAWALEQACWAVLIVPVIGVPAVVDAIVELLLDIHMFKLRCHRRHLEPPPLLSPDSWAIERPLRKTTKPAAREKKDWKCVSASCSVSVTRHESEITHFMISTVDTEQ